MGFTEHLQQKLTSFPKSATDHTAYTKDAEVIINYLIQKLKEKDSPFDDGLVSLGLCGSYLDQVMLDVPDKFYLYMKLKCPFKNWLNHVLRKAFPENFVSELDGQSYVIIYKMGMGCAHTIKAVSKSRTLSIDLVPALEFPGSQWPFSDPPVPQEVRDAYSWLATPKWGPNGELFRVSAPLWENALIKENHKFKDVLLLMKRLRDAHEKDLPELSSYMIKTVLLHRVATVDWGRDLGDLLVEMWGHLVEYLQKGNLQDFMTKNENLILRMQPQNRQTCLTTTEELLKSLEEAKLAVDKFDKIFA